MSKRAVLRERLNRVRRTGDAGITLVELVVSMTIMSVVMAIFTGGIIEMYNSANKNESLSTAQSEVNIMFLRLDREIRYAAGISLPDVVGGDSYVEYLTGSTGTALCTELRLNVALGQLQRRTWLKGSTPSPVWTPMASGVTSGTPFTFAAADATFRFQRLELKFNTTSGSAVSSVTTTQTDITFTALNTSQSTVSAAACTEGRSYP
jgi:type II secretory pathway pseudopilin PulG